MLIEDGDETAACVERCRRICVVAVCEVVVSENYLNNGHVAKGRKNAHDLEMKFAGVWKDHYKRRFCPSRWDIF